MLHTKPTKHLVSHENPSCLLPRNHLPSKNSNILLALKLHPDGNSCLYFQPHHFRILLSSKLHPDVVTCSLFQLKHFRILMLHPYGKSCSPLQPNLSRILPWSSIPLTILAPHSSQTYSKSYLEVPSSWQILFLIPTKLIQNLAFKFHPHGKSCFSFQPN